MISRHSKPYRQFRRLPTVSAIKLVKTNSGLTPTTTETGFDAAAALGGLGQEVEVKGYSDGSAGVLGKLECAGRNAWVNLDFEVRSLLEDEPEDRVDGAEQLPSLDRFRIAEFLGGEHSRGT